MQDYKSKGKKQSNRSNRFALRYNQWWKTLALGIGCAMVIISLLPIPLGNASPKPQSTKTLEISQTPSQQLEKHLRQVGIPSSTLPSHLKEPTYDGRIELKLESDTEVVEQTPPQSIQHTATVAKGDSLSAIFKRLELPQSQLHFVMNAGADAKRLKYLRPGQKLKFEIGQNQVVKKIIYRFDDDAVLEIALNKDGQKYQARMIAENLEHRPTSAMGIIDQSLFLAGQRAELSDKVIMQLVGIFAWDVDFALDVRSGDQFSVIYEQLYKEGEKIRDGNILAAEFINQGKVFRAVRYKKGKNRADYYTPDGRNMRKAFLRTPVAFSRISSKFQLRRWHPILHKFRAHRGVDYAAPRGTKVKVTGNGKVTFVGRKGQLGKAIFVQHADKYTTVYGHLHKYARGIKRGKSVKQGQTIGYVGSTGLATGPHLHYEFRVRGQHKDPLKVKLPQAKPIEARYRSDFRSKTEKSIAQLKVLSRIRLALR
uniref:Murein DD-endopeptidase MepM and murein hydrolase activator NlpD, contain LysM domain n=1 Tax=Candidatus Kentrum sp. TUN TaxID=2126343 RepID=A0A450ZL42_9GAMM|nr:MAG: Murein DD-endopeptidase MepM and murein hydrolase activator NlpD, contain LysM domain [Candidatus Kentron sp. TUN]VFK57105.1 MAG: Murein DD-endopeptidase MepM and murein hydrolase activator NlpD, contain LysM domain [Candidatus Kentron sp. TUN]